MTAIATDVGSVDVRETVSVKDVSLSDLYNQAKIIQEDCVDYNVSNVGAHNLFFNAETGKLNFQSDSDLSTQRFDMTRFSMSQLCTKLGVPARYIEKCVDNGRVELAGENVNTWIHDYGKNLFVRTYKDKIRGVLSNRYMTLDAPDVLDVLSDVIDPDDFVVKGHFLTPERFHARIVDRELMPIKMDDLFAGIQVDSSDVGRSTLTVSFFIYKQVCSNGLIVAKQGGYLFNQRHIGINVDDFRKGFEAAVAEIPILAETYHDVVRKARGMAIEPDKDMLALIKTQTGMSDDAVDKVIATLNDSYEPTYWGLINAVTDVAKDFTLERRIEIERAAGNLLSRVA